MTKGIGKNARQAALETLGRVFSAGAYADIVLQKELERVAPRDRALATEIVYGVLRWQLRLDFVIDTFSSIKTRKLELNVLNALRIGAYQLLFLDNVPSSAAVNESVNLVKAGNIKKAGFVNAVLRSIDRERKTIKPPERNDGLERHLSITYSHPEWLVRRWIERLGPEKTETFCKANQTRPPKTIRANTIIITRDNLITELESEGFVAHKTAFSPDGVNISSSPPQTTLGSSDPRFYAQDEASQLIARLVGPRPGETILDACAAPGGKTAHLAALMENRGLILATDRYPGRIKTINEISARLGITIIKTLAADATLALPLKETGCFDAILLDAPCSGLGVLRRSPDIKIRRKEADIIELSKTQKEILENVSQYVKKGGRLVYSVCTIEPEETDMVIGGFLRTHPEFVVEDASKTLPPSCETLVDDKGFLRTMPGTGDMDCFFAARLIKAG